MAAPPLSFDAGFTVGAQIEARAEHPVTAEQGPADAGRPHLDLPPVPRRVACAWRIFSCRRLGTIDDARPGHVAMVLENHFELLALYGGCAYAGLTLFGVNTGLRGEVLAGRRSTSRARGCWSSTSGCWPEVERVRGELTARGAGEHPRPAHRAAATLDARRDLLRLPRTRGRRRPAQSLDAPGVDVDARPQPDGDLHLGHHRPAEGHQQQPHQAAAPPAWRSRPTSALGAGRRRLRLHAAVPLERHVRRLHAGLLGRRRASALRERFSASQFVPDVLRYGVTFWNYVGEPVHYVLAAIEKQYGGDEAAHRRRGHQQPAQQAALRRRQRRRAARHRPLHANGWGWRTCSSSTARPRRRSAPSAARAIRAAASARSPTRR